MSIDWNNLEEVEAALGIPDIDTVEGFGTVLTGNLEKLCTGKCGQCMTHVIDDIGTKLSAILCCKSHPETGEVDDSTGACPNYNMENGKCNIYGTDEYPAACANYHCKTHNR